MRLVSKSTLGNGQIAAITNEATNKQTIYALLDNNNVVVTQLHLQDGAPPENGFCIEDLLTIALDRIRQVNSELPSQRNLDALDHIDAALLSLHNRMQERQQAK